MKLFRFVIAATAALVLTATFASAADRVTPEYAKQNLDLVPPTDPEAKDAPKLLPAVANQHPRLLFTQADIDKLNAAIPNNPILKATYDDNLATFKRFHLQPWDAEHPPAIVVDDTAALSTSMQSYAGLAYFYSLTKDPALKASIISVLDMMLAQPYWTDGKELDSNMGCSCNMLMTAVLFDAVANDLDPEYRAKVANKILVHARRMYYLGFKQLCTGSIKYWQQDPQPNHRWYRIAGTLGSLLAIQGEPNVPNSDYILREMKKEMDFVMKWYPPDGDCHEGAGYQQFGFASILRAALMMDRDLGTTYLKDSGLTKAWSQQIYYTTPDGGEQMSFGDDMNGPGIFNKLDAAFFECMAVNRDKNAMAMFMRYYNSKNTYPVDPNAAPAPAPAPAKPVVPPVAKAPASGAATNAAPPAAIADASKPPAKPKAPAQRKWTNPWDMLEFYDPTVGEGDYKALPTNRLFADLGAATFRNSWEPTATAFTFKCGPYGGYKLNEYRNSTPDQYGNPHYVNIAHDDPDANSFSMTIGSEFMFHPGLYSFKKVSEEQSTILVDGKGQIVEGSDFLQPVDGADMRKFSYLTGWKQGDKGRAIIEGEAGPAYIGMNYDELYAYQYPETVPDPAAPGQPPNPKKPRNPVTGPIKPPPPAVLSRYRRSAIWMPGEYVLLLDDIRTASGQHDIAWGGTVNRGKIVNAAEGRCQVYARDGTSCDFQILANKDFNGSLDFEMLTGRFGNFLAHRFEFSAKTDAIKFATLFDPWKKKPTLTFKDNGDTATLTVKSDSFTDTWTWKAPKDDHTPSVIEGTRAGTPLISLTESDKAPTE